MRYNFVSVLLHYSVEILPALAAGFFLSGLMHEFIPQEWVERHLGEKGIKPIFYAIITGTLLPICCWGALPVAVSFHKKGSRLGPILAFLVATPATSVSALLVTYKLLGLKFAVFIFFAAILVGMLMGIIGDRINLQPKLTGKDKCPHCEVKLKEPCCRQRKSFSVRMGAVFKFAFWDMPRDIGRELILGVILAALVATFVPLGLWIRHNLGGLMGYIFVLIFGLVMYICATASVPLVHAFVKQGLSSGAGMALLLLGPITSYGTIMVLRKEFGMKILLVYLSFISAASLILGYLFSLI